MHRQKSELRRLSGEIDATISKLGELTKSKPRAPPPHGSVREQRAALEELQTRASLLEDDILPKLAQLAEPGKADESATALAGSKPLSQQSSAELSELSVALRARVDVTGAVLAEYESLGQPAPPSFRGWPLPELKQRLDDLSSKRAELREIVRLLAQLKGQRMDWNLPAKSAEELRAHAARLTEKVSEANERKERAALLGKIEAEMWKRNEEVPVATGTLSIPELKALLLKLQQPRAAEDAA